MRRLPSCALSVWIALALAGAAPGAERLLKADDLKVLGQPASTMMRDYLTAIVEKQFARREAELAELRTAEDWRRRADRIRRAMAAWTGDFPPPTPLNARVTGRLERGGYVLEKLLFESRPGFLVSANVYLPKRADGPRPAVLNVIGHSPAGKATEKVQRRSIAQVRKGFVVLTVDALGQGERQVPEYADYGKPPGNAHRAVGLQAFLAGAHVFNLMAWDVIRSLDYLTSRPEVDPDRIACTGCSGGGMMTTYILALDGRISVAVPACNPNSWVHRVRAGLATDHEQVFFGAFTAGIDPRGDPLFCHVPEPLLIDATTEDNLNPPLGVWELSGWLDRAYAAHGAPERCKTVMIRGPHGYNLEQREAAYAWMLKWTGGDASQFREDDFSVEREEDTWAARGGNVFVGEGSWRPHQWVLEQLERRRAHWAPVRTADQLQRHRGRLREELRRLGLAATANKPAAKMLGETLNGPLRIERFVLNPEPEIALPAVWLERRSADERDPVVLYVNDQGSAALAEEPLVEELVVRRGFRILAVDLRGFGETAPGEENKFWDFLAGRPIFAQRVADARAALAWLAEAQPKAAGVHVWGAGVSGLCAALAALDRRVASLTLERPLLSFESVVKADAPGFGNEILLPGVLEHFDLPQAYQALCQGPDRVALIEPLGGDGRSASPRETADAYRAVRATYEALGRAEAWRVVTRPDAAQRRQAILDSLVR